MINRPAALQNINKAKLINTLQVMRGFIILVMVIIGATIVTGGAFVRPSNLLEVAQRASIVGMVALGQSLVIFTGGIDLSVGAVMGLCIAIMSFGLKAGVDPMLTVLCALMGATVCGIANGLMVCRTKIPPFVVTLGMMMIAQSLALTIIGARAEDMPQLVEAINRLTGFIPSGPKLLAIFVWIVSLSIVALWMVFTRYGYNMFAVGGSERTAVYSGINVPRTKLTVYVLSGLFAGIASVLLEYRLGGANPVAGQAFLIDSIAAAVIGGTSLYGGEGNIFSTIVGVFALAIMINVMNIIRINPFIQDVVVGAILLFFVFVLEKLRTLRVQE